MLKNANPVHRSVQKDSLYTLTIRLSPAPPAQLVRQLKPTTCLTTLTAVNQLPASQRPNVDLEAYIINQSIERLFVEIGKEEGKIRRDPVGRGGELIGRVFGAR